MAEYQSLGSRQSLFHTKLEKQWLFTAYTHYQKELASKQCVHAPFYLLDMRNKFKCIMVDEAQDLSHLQLKTLSSLACNKQICYFEDNRQSLSDNKSKIPFLKNLMHSWGANENHITFHASWRCPRAVINMANTVIRA